MNRIYYTDRTDMDPRILIDAYWDQVSEERRNKALQSRALEVQANSLLAGYLIEYGYRNWIGNERLDAACRGKSTQIAYGAKGKPYFRNRPEIHFNISHSGKIAACAFSDKEIGLDIQQMRTYRKSLAGHFFRKEEQEWLRRAGEKGEKEELLFYKLWTIKESYVKFTGEGLGSGLDSFVIREDLTGAGEAFCRNFTLPGREDYVGCICTAEEETPELIFVPLL